MGRLLLVDDRLDDREILRSAAVRAGFDEQDISLVSSANQARGELVASPFQLAVIDIWLPEEDDGLDLIKHLKKNQPGCRIIAVTAEPDDEDGVNPSGVKALKAGADDFVCKSDVDLYYIKHIVKRLKLWKGLIGAPA